MRLVRKWFFKYGGVATAVCFLMLIGRNGRAGEIPLQDTMDATLIFSNDTLNRAAGDTAAADLPGMGVSGGEKDSAESAASMERSGFSQDATMFRVVRNRAFSVGEILIFEVAWKFVKAGTAVMSIPDTVHVKGRPCYQIVTMAKSNSFFDAVYKVRDRVESLADTAGLFTWKFEKHIREGHYETDRIEIFDQWRHWVIVNGDTMPVPPNIMDILTSFYYTRTLDLVPGNHFDMDNFGDGKVYPLRVLIHGKERVEVPAGVFDCIVVEPVMREEGIFKQTGKLTIYLTDDERKIPVLVKSKILVGSIDVRLKAIQAKMGN